MRALPYLAAAGECLELTRTKEMKGERGICIIDGEDVRCGAAVSNRKPAR